MPPSDLHVLPKSAEQALFQAFGLDNATQMASVLKQYKFDVNEHRLSGDSSFPTGVFPLHLAAGMSAANCAELLLKPVSEGGFGADINQTVRMEHSNLKKDVSPLHLLIGKLSATHTPATEDGQRILKCFLSHPQIDVNISAVDDSHMTIVRDLLTDDQHEMFPVLQMILSHPLLDKKKAAKAVEYYLTGGNFLLGKSFPVSSFKPMALALKCGVPLTSEMLHNAGILIAHASAAKPQCSYMSVGGPPSKERFNALFAELTAMYEEGLLTPPNAPAGFSPADEIEAADDESESLISLLVMAVCTDSVPVMKYFLKKCAATKEAGEMKKIVNKLYLRKGVNENTRETLVSTAATRGSDDMVRYLLDLGADFAIRSEGGFYTRMNAFDLACLEGRVSVIRIFAKAGANVNACEEGWDGLTLAAAEHHWDACALLLDLGANPNFVPTSENYSTTALEAALGEDHLATVKFLLKKGADPLLANKDGVRVCSQALHFHSGNKVLNAILGSPKMHIGAKDEDGMSFLHHAAFHSSDKMLLILQRLEKETAHEPAMRSSIVNAEAKDKLTPLMIALEFQPDNVIPLLKAGADPTRCVYVPMQNDNERVDSSTKVWNIICGLVRRPSKFSLLELLLTGNLHQQATGKNSNASKAVPPVDLNAGVHKPLWFAVMTKNIEALNLFIKAGVDLSVRVNKQGETVLHTAARRKNRIACLRLLGVARDTPVTARPLNKAPRSDLIYKTDVQGFTPLNWADDELAEELMLLTHFDPALIEPAPACPAPDDDAAKADAMIFPTTEMDAME